ncbi:hypothetical protein BD289DRAFT_471799 [Coniella lustricola]|uniref:F-box domain-containing protein n=1 Tax=Coniella lustricola TaxID=2025994 RepID=A0A2T3AIA9_9PEZI|nr:hypothetical protein BD289DRAFT_471799 [Coniella lustricola]
MTESQADTPPQSRSPAWQPDVPLTPDLQSELSSPAAVDSPTASQVAAQSFLSPGSCPQMAKACRLASDAQPTPLISHQYARQETKINHARLAADEDRGRHPMQPAVAQPQPWMSVVPGCEDQCSAAGAGAGAGGDVVAAREDANIHTSPSPSLTDLPTELLVCIFGFLDVSDLLVASRISHQFRSLALAPIVHRTRLRHARAALPPLLLSPSRPSLADLIARHIFLTHTTVVSRKLARSLTAIRLSRRLAVRPPPEALVARSVLPAECFPGHARVAPALVAKTRAVERERVKDGLRQWVGSVWERRWKERAEDRRRWEERSGVGRVWKLRRFWERVGRGEEEELNDRDMYV